MTTKFIAIHPTPETWESSNPEFVKEELSITDRLIRIVPNTWYYLEGIELHFLKQGDTASYWHFTIDSVKIEQ